MATKDQQVNYPVKDNNPNGFNNNQIKPVLHHNSNKPQNNGYSSCNKNLNYYYSNLPQNQQKPSKKKFIYINHYNTGYQNGHGYNNQTYHHNGNYHNKFNTNYNNMNQKSQNKNTLKSLTYHHRYNQTSNQNANFVDLKYDSAGNSTSASNSVTPPTSSSNSNSTNTTASPSSNLASPTASSLNSVSASTSNNENTTNGQLNKTIMVNNSTESENTQVDQQQPTKQIVEESQKIVVEPVFESTVANNLFEDLSKLQIDNGTNSKSQQQIVTEQNHTTHATNSTMSFKSNAGGTGQQYSQSSYNNGSGKLAHSPKEQMVNSAMPATSTHYNKQQPLQNNSNYIYGNNKHVNHPSNKVFYNNYQNNSYQNNLNGGYQFSTKMNSYPSKMNNYPRGKGKLQHVNGGPNNLQQGLNGNNKNLNHSTLNQSNLPNNVVKSVKNVTNHPHPSNKLLNHHITNANLLQNHPHSMIASPPQLIQQLPNGMFYSTTAGYPSAVSFPTSQSHNVAQQLNHPQSSNLANHQQPLQNLHPPNCYPNCCTQGGIYFTANSPNGHPYLIPQPPPNAYSGTGFHPVATSAPLTQPFFSFAPYHFNNLNGNLVGTENNNGNLANYREYRDLNSTGRQQSNGNVLINNSNSINHQSSGNNGNLNNKYNQQTQLDLTTTHYLPANAQFTYNPYMQILPNYYTTANSYLQPPANNESQQQLTMITNTSTGALLTQQQLTSGISNIHPIQQNPNTVVNQQQSGQSQQDHFAITNAVNVDAISNDHSRSNGYETSVQVNGGLLQTSNQIAAFNEQLNPNAKFFATYNSNAIADYNQMAWQNSVSNNLNGNTNDDLSSHNLINVNVNYLQQTVDKATPSNFNEGAPQPTDNNLVADKKRIEKLKNEI